MPPQKPNAMAEKLAEEQRIKKDYQRRIKTIDI